MIERLRRGFKPCTIVSVGLAILLGLYVAAGIVGAVSGAAQARLHRSPPDASMGAAIALAEIAGLSLFVGLPTAALAHRYRRAILIAHLLIPFACVWVVLMLEA